MTTGNVTYSSLSSGNATNLVTSATTPCSSGTLRSRVWNGSDSLTKTNHSPVPNHKIAHVIDSSGARVRVKYDAGKRKRFIRDNPFSCTYIEDKQPKGFSYFYRYVKSTGAFYDANLWVDCNVPALHGARNHLPLPTFPANKDIAMINNLKTKVRGSDFNMAVFLGEGRETLQMIGDTAIKIGRSIRAIRKGDLNLATDILLSKKSKGFEPPERLRRPNKHKFDRDETEQQAASHWLQLQYGWLPLLGDVYGAAELLAHRLNMPFRQRHKVRMSQIQDYGTISHHYPSALSNDAPRYALARTSVKKQIIAEISEPESLPALAGLLDPELVAWELVPFSFVVDWFLPIGNYLEARASASRLTGRYTTTVVSLKELGKGSFPSYSDSSFNYVYTSNIYSSYKRTHVDIVRSVSTSLPVPMPRLKRLSEIASWQHCTNALALLKLVFR